MRLTMMECVRGRHAQWQARGWRVIAMFLPAGATSHAPQLLKKQILNELFDDIRVSVAKSFQHRDMVS